MDKILKIVFVIFFLLSINLSFAQKTPYVNNENISLVSDGILIYPNPVTEKNFYVKSDDTIRVVEVLNMLGQNIKTIYNETGVAYNIFVELNDVKNGIYMVRVVLGNEKVFIRKIILK
jgi:hypothetical protein